MSCFILIFLQPIQIELAWNFNATTKYEGAVRDCDSDVGAEEEEEELEEREDEEKESEEWKR